jgi:hypothetical protein
VKTETDQLTAAPAASMPKMLSATRHEQLQLSVAVLVHLLDHDKTPPKAV